MVLCPELVAKPTKDKPATKLVCNFQQQVCLLIRGWSLHATLSLFRLPVQMDESTHSGGFDQQQHWSVCGCSRQPAARPNARVPTAGRERL